MHHLISVFLILVFISCNTQQSTAKNEKVSVSSAGMEQMLHISAKFLTIEKTPKKFKVLAIIKNETGITSFSKGDTISLYPNFIRKEGQGLNTKNSENEKMASLQTLALGSLFNATIKIRGQGNKRHGLIMDWEELK